MALEHAVVKNKINEIMRSADQDAFLPGFKTESMAQFLNVRLMLTALPACAAI